MQTEIEELDMYAGTHLDGTERYTADALIEAAREALRDNLWRGRVLDRINRKRRFEVKS